MSNIVQIEYYSFVLVNEYRLSTSVADQDSDGECTQMHRRAHNAGLKKTGGSGFRQKQEKMRHNLLAI